MGEEAEFASWFGFADFLINSHTYAVRLTLDPDDGGPVAIPEFNSSPPFPSFVAFLEAYLAVRSPGYSVSFPIPPGS